MEAERETKGIEDAHDGYHRSYKFIPKFPLKHLVFSDVPDHFAVTGASK